MNRRSCRVAVPLRYFGWNGGLDFTRHIVSGLKALSKKRSIKIFVLVPVVNRVETTLDALRVFKRSLFGSIERRRPWIALPSPIYDDSALDIFQHTEGVDVEIVYHEHSDAGFRRCLKNIDADVVLPVNGSLGRDFPFAWVGYMPDFQHKYLPGNFSADECFKREYAFTTTLREAKVVIVNSMAVKSDICNFYPWVEPSVIINLPFSPHPMLTGCEPSRQDLEVKYRLPKKYFLVSNQFWIHKDHLTAFKAMGHLSSLPDICLVCTGAMVDYRRPGYLEELKSYIHTNQLKDKIRLLGMIPKADQLGIMKESCGVLQPTMFEGGPGGGSVYDAVAMGVPVILSDIAVNKEVAAKNVFFFRAGDEKDLAEKMGNLLSSDVIAPSKDELLEVGAANLERLGDRLYQAIERATA